MRTISQTNIIYYLHLRSTLKDEDIPYQHRMGGKEDGSRFYDVRILPGADEDKVNAALEQHQTWVQAYENRKTADGWIDSL